MNRAANHIKLASLAILLFAAGFVGGQNTTLNYIENGGARTVIGGSIDVVSGGEIDIESGGAFKIAGVTVSPTATELNSTSLASTGAVLRKKRLPITTTPTGAEQSTGWQLPPKCKVIDVTLDTTTAEAVGATKTLDVGLLSSETGGDTDGLMKDVSVATVNVTAPYTTVQIGASENFFASTTRGALLGEFTAGSDSAGDVGTDNPHPHTITTAGAARTVVYDADSNDWTGWRGAIVVTYEELQ